MCLLRSHPHGSHCVLRHAEAQLLVESSAPLLWGANLERTAHSVNVKPETTQFPSFPPRGRPSAEISARLAQSARPPKRRLAVMTLLTETGGQGHRRLADTVLQHQRN